MSYSHDQSQGRQLRQVETRSGRRRQVAQGVRQKCFYVCRNSSIPNDLMVWCEGHHGADEKFAKSAELRQGDERSGRRRQAGGFFLDKMEDLTRVRQRCLTV